MNMQCLHTRLRPNLREAVWNSFPKKKKKEQAQPCWPEPQNLDRCMNRLRTVAVPAQPQKKLNARGGSDLQMDSWHFT